MRGATAATPTTTAAATAAIPPPTKISVYGIQAAIMNWMPVIITFSLAKFPVGLVIYWTWNNLLSTVQQWIVMRRRRAA